MAITYPRLLPENLRMTEAGFQLIDNVALSPYANGTSMNLSQVVDPVWQGRFQTGLLELEKLFEWSAWRASLRGGFKTFLAYDVRRKTPLAYQTAKVSTDISPGWNGSCAVTSLGLSGALGLSGLPAGYKISAGDRIGLVQAGRYAYYEALETVVGNAVTVTVSPFLHTRIFTTGATAVLWRPLVNCVIEQASWIEPSTPEPGPVSFNAFQRI